MVTDFQVTFDCADPERLTRFWSAALGYREQDPPTGYESWEDWLRANGIPEQDWNSMGAVVDPEERRPRLLFQRVPEPKSVKNRVHLDLNVGPGLRAPLEDRRAAVDAEVERLVGLGATVMHPGRVERDEYWVVMQDPEGNEFCVQ